MRRPCAFLLLVLVLASASGVRARLLPVRTDDPLSYTLDVRLDAANRLLIGHGRVSWRNPSTRPATELRLYLAWNAWRDARSSWMNEQRLAGNDPLAGLADEDLGFVDLTSLAEAGRTDVNLLERARFVAPDDGNGHDHTVLAVPLARPVAPGAEIELEFAWNGHVPRPFDRTGVIDHTFVFTSWFPQVGVLEDDGWHAHQVHVGTGSFGEFARYDVRLTVPANWLVGATGVEAARVDKADGSAQHRYVAEGVQDFAWTTGPDYVERMDRIGQPGARDIAVRLLVQPEHLGQVDRQLAAVRSAMEVYRRWLGPYPWPMLTIVDPVAVINARAQGAGIAPAAYPMLIIAGTRWLAPWTAPLPEEVITEQVGREYWSAIVSADTIAHPWLGDGLAEFTATTVLREAFPDRLTTVTRYLGGLVAWPYADVAWRPRAAESSPVFSRNLREPTPTRAAAWLSTLADTAGRSATVNLLAEYYARAAHAHPAPDTFFGAARASVSDDLTWFIDGLSHADVTVDYAVREVVATSNDTGSLDTTIVLDRLGDGSVPVDVRTTFADDATVVERWDGRDTVRVLKYRRGSAVVAVDIDPEHRLHVEQRRTNNSWLAAPAGHRAADKWSLRWLVWFQHMLITYAFFV
jgi:hypothetical protein